MAQSASPINTRLSVNVNKIAWLRNARGGNLPDLQQAVRDIERFGAQGITVHPRPDERHIRRSDVRELRGIVQSEFNVEGYPSVEFLALMEEVKPDQVTLVPDPPEALTSSAGWDTIRHKEQLVDAIAALQAYGSRVSLFLEPQESAVDAAKLTGTDRVEFYTGPYAEAFHGDRETAIAPFARASAHATYIGLGVNAGHDLNLDNLRYFRQNLPDLLEVSIGHALVCDALYLGLENTVQRYLREIEDGARQPVL
jgi:pyridoxine 5-phosphate synthase